MSVRALVDELIALGGTINATQGLSGADRLTVARWKPVKPPAHPPALWHWLTEPPAPEIKDLHRLREHVTVSAYIGTRHASQDRDLARLERLSDAYVEAIDPQLYLTQRNGGPGPLNGTATWAQRSGRRLVAVDFAGAEWVAVEIPLEFWLDKALTN